jgi:RHS repeat-associated protein
VFGFEIGCVYGFRLGSCPTNLDKQKPRSPSLHINSPAEGKRIGPAIMLKVNAGDIVTADAFGKYIDKTGSNTFTVDDLVGLLASAFGYTAGSVETGIQYSGMDNGMGLLGLLKPQQDGVRAYLNYILFDNNFLDPEVGYEPLPDGATTYQKLSKMINIGKNGYLYLYVSCESLYDYKVYFDDIAVSVEKSNITASTDYYPFGMAIAENSTGLDDPVTNKYLYNGKELQNELGLDWYDYGWRQYDPAIGEVFKCGSCRRSDEEGISICLRISIIPVRFTDPDGMVPEDNVDDDDDKKRRSIEHTYKNDENSTKGTDVVQEKQVEDLSIKNKKGVP